MKLLSGIKFVFETKDGDRRIFKAVFADGSEDKEVLDLSALAEEGFKVVFEKSEGIFGKKADGSEVKIDVSKFLA